MKSWDFCKKRQTKVLKPRSIADILDLLSITLAHQKMSWFGNTLSGLATQVKSNMGKSREAQCSIINLYNMFFDWINYLQASSVVDITPYVINFYVLTDSCIIWFSGTVLWQLNYAPWHIHVYAPLNLVIINLGNGTWAVGCRASTWTIADSLLSKQKETYFYILKKVLFHLKFSSAGSRSFC